MKCQEEQGRQNQLRRLLMKAAAADEGQDQIPSSGIPVPPLHQLMKWAAAEEEWQAAAAAKIPVPPTHGHPGDLIPRLMKALCLDCETMRQA